MQKPRTEVLMSGSFCVFLPKRYLGRHACDKALLKMTLCTNVLIKSQNQASICLLSVSS